MRMRIKVLLAAVLVLAGGVWAVQAEKYIVASDIPWPPFEWASPSGDYLGFDLDVMRCIAVLEGYEIEIQPMAFDSIIPAVRLGQVDIGASGFTITAKREEVVDFSNPYWLSNQAVLVRKDSGFKSLDDVLCCGHKIGAQRGTTGADWVQSNLVDKGVDVKLVLYETYPEAVLDLVNGRLDAVVQDEPASQQSLAAYPKVLTTAGVIETNEYFGFLVAQGDPKGLLPKINEGMVKMGLRCDLMRPAEGQWKVKLRIIPGSAWDYLVRAYFGPKLEKVEAAWKACIKILYDKSLSPEERVFRFAKCLAEKASE
ncbi:transporter substrate-binding domain-containing protein [Candidatus Bipolaricaulota bacterium]|nr:transporter substrate-binding domain-containing protein [Candidatus Bipolaricaulota bacterium]